MTGMVKGALSMPVMLSWDVKEYSVVTGGGEEGALFPELCGAQNHLRSTPRFLPQVLFNLFYPQHSLAGYSPPKSQAGLRWLQAGLVAHALAPPCLSFFSLLFTRFHGPSQDDS